MLYFIAALLMIIGFTFKSNKKITGLMCVFLWLLFGWSYGNADYNIHLRRFSQFQDQSWQTEPLYTLLMKTFNALGLNYRIFLIAFGIFILYTYVRLAKRHTRYVNFVLAMYMIFPLCMDVTLVRYALSMAVVTLGYSYLFSKEKFELLKYVAIVLIATLIHVSSIFALLLILPKFFNRKKLISVVAIGCIALSLLGGAVMALAEKITTISFMNIGAKVGIILAASKMKYNALDYIKYDAKIIMIFCTFTFVYYLIYRWARKHYIPEISNNLEVLDLIFDMNIAVLFIVPLVVFSVDIFRIQLSLLLVNYIGIAQFFEIRRKIGVSLKRGTTTWQTLLVLFGSILYAFSGLYLWVLSNSNIDSVFRALFENNTLIH